MTYIIKLERRIIIVQGQPKDVINIRTVQKNKYSLERNFLVCNPSKKKKTEMNIVCSLLVNGLTVSHNL